MGWLSRKMISASMGALRVHLNAHPESIPIVKSVIETSLDEVAGKFLRSINLDNDTTEGNLIHLAGSVPRLNAIQLSETLTKIADQCKADNDKANYFAYNSVAAYFLSAAEADFVSPADLRTIGSKKFSGLRSVVDCFKEILES